MIVWTSSFSMSRIYYFLKYLRYRQTSSGNHVAEPSQQDNG